MDRFTVTLLEKCLQCGLLCNLPHLVKVFRCYVGTVLPEDGLRKGDVLPGLRDILEENFIEDGIGRWHVPDLEKQIDLENLKHESLMKEFNLYKEMAQKTRARIKDHRDSNFAL